MIDVRRLRPILLASLLLASGLEAASVGTAFTYQGRLNVGAAPYTGTCDLGFTLWDAAGSGSPPTGGSQIGSPLGAVAVSVTGGLFTTSLDFGATAFPGQDRWLQIAVGCPSGMATTTLAPRQQLTATPYALGLPFLRSPSGTASPNVVGGYSGNAADAGSSGITIAGGGAFNNLNLGSFDYATVGGGAHNNAGASYATIAGGSSNYIGGDHATIGGGQNNSINPHFATISGGYGNTADGSYSMIPGGASNHAAGDSSFAAGHRAKANNIGDFVWADSNDFDFTDSTDNRFRVRATGGVVFVVGIDGTGAATWTCTLTNNNSLACTSDRNMKENLEPVDSGDVLDKVSRLPILRWNAKGADPNVKHVGPMAQDFKAAFGLGDDEKLISTIDLDGVSLAAIQALKKRNEELEERLRAVECALESMASLRN
jgi:hypothetical protein